MHQEQTLREEDIFEGRVIRVKRLTVQLPNGRTSTREVVLHRGAVAVLVEPEPAVAVLVRQYRKACESALWEIPAGKLEVDEEPESAAFRELSEETGYEATQLTHLFSFYTAPGFSNEMLHVYYAKDVTPGDVHLDEDEFVEVRHVTKSEAQMMIQTGQIRDAKTMAALLWWIGRTA